jgi:hypothetical protein
MACIQQGIVTEELVLGSGRPHWVRGTWSRGKLPDSCGDYPGEANKFWQVLDGKALAPFPQLFPNLHNEIFGSHKAFVDTNAADQPLLPVLLVTRPKDRLCATVGETRAASVWIGTFMPLATYPS